jgi:hypothetical protein
MLLHRIFEDGKIVPRVLPNLLFISTGCLRARLPFIGIGTCHVLRCRLRGERVSLMRRQYVLGLSRLAIHCGQCSHMLTKFTSCYACLSNAAGAAHLRSIRCGSKAYPLPRNLKPKAERLERLDRKTFLLMVD